MKITDDYLPINKYSRPGSKITPTKIAVHYVGNAGSSAKGNRNYFASGKVYASSHYIVGLEGEILRLIPENEISYCTNQANSYTISIECCHPDSTGKFNNKTLTALTELCADICKRRGFNPLTDIIRHYDVTKKACPLWWAPNGTNKNANADFAEFKQSVKNMMQNETTEIKEDDEMVETGTITVNGKDLKIDKIVKDGVTYIKLRGLENAGFDVDYNADTKNLTLDNVTKDLSLLVDDNAKIVEAVNIGGYNYCKLRDLAESLGKSVDVVDGEIVIE